MRAIVETLHHGNFRKVTTTPLAGDVLTLDDAVVAVSSSPYSYADRAGVVFGDLKAFGRADLGWSTFVLQ